MKKLTPKNVHLLCWIILAVGTILALFGLAIENTALMVIGVVILLASVVFRCIFYRCPHCGRYLDRSTGQYCPYCGRNVNK